MNITEAHAVDKVLRALGRLTWSDDLTTEESDAVQVLAERAAKPLLVSPDAIGQGPR